MDGHLFTVKLNVIFYKKMRHAGMCDEHDSANGTWLKIRTDGKDGFWELAIP